MTIAYCFSCGAQKSSPIAFCGSCRKAPAAEVDLVKSLILSDEVSTQGQLAHFANEVQSKQRLTAPDSLVAKAREVARDPKYQRALRATQPPRAAPQSTSVAVAGANVYTQGGVLREALGIQIVGSKFAEILAKGSNLPCSASKAFTTGADNQEQITLQLCAGDSSISNIIQLLGRYQISGIAPMPKGKSSILVELEADLGGVTLRATDNIAKTALAVKRVSRHPMAVEPPQATSTSSPSKSEPRLTTTALHRSAFAVLGVTTRDNRRRIVELAEEKSLELDHDVCQKACSDLTNPRARLGAEIGWLPGVSPRKATQLVEELLQDPMAVREESSLPTLAHLNLLAAAFEAVGAKHDAKDLVSFITETANVAEDLIPEEVLRDINEDRAVSGFPEVRALDQVEAELTERKRYYRGAIKAALDRLPPMTLIQVMTETVNGATSGGEDHAPELIDDLVDTYEVEAQGVLQKEAENVHKLIKAVRDHADHGETAIQPFMDKLDSVARNWDMIAQPIQLSSKARGVDHEASCDLANVIRSLSVDLFNKHDMLAQSQRLTGLIQELFSEVPEIADRTEEDADTLAEIFEKRKQAAVRRDEWAREITYRAAIGVMFKDTLSISPEGISWKRQNFPLDSITRVRWGGTRHSINGVPKGTTYTVAFGDQNSEAVVELKNCDIYTTFVDKLQLAVANLLAVKILEAIKAGRVLQFGDALLHDDGITLVKHKLFDPDGMTHCLWGQTHIWVENGAFYIGAKDDKQAYVQLSYINDANTHILEMIVRAGYKEPGMSRLSELLS